MPSTSAAVSWHTLDRVSRKPGSAWGILSRRSVFPAVSWHTFEAADPAQALLSWEVRKREAELVPFVWEVHQRGAVVRGMTWSLARALLVLGRMRWGLKETRARQAGISYDVAQQAGSLEADSAWGVLELGSRAAASAWSAFRTQRHVREAAWSVYQEVSPILAQAAWQLYGHQHVEVDALWSVRARLPVQGLAQWAVTSLVTSRQAELAWRVREFEIDPDYPLTTQSRFRWQSEANRKYQYGTGTPDN